MYILAPDKKIKKYPYTISELRSDNPTISFPKQPDDELLAEWGVYRVTVSPIPDIDYTKNFSEGVPELVEGEWQQVWIISEASAQEVRERKQQHLNQLKSQRSNAYREESDPLFFKWQAGEGAETEWITKRQEIRARYPYPEDEA
jgi:hypothetical protein